MRCFLLFCLWVGHSFRYGSHKVPIYFPYPQIWEVYGRYMATLWEDGSKQGGRKGGYLCGISWIVGGIFVFLQAME